jgi:hypothetical protein
VKGPEEGDDENGDMPMRHGDPYCFRLVDR